jgi:hypothetical protein
MSLETFRSNARGILSHMLEQSQVSPLYREQLLEQTLNELEQLYASEAHHLMNQVLDDARMRLEARLSPDPVNQTIASVQTTVQDLLDSFWRE